MSALIQRTALRLQRGSCPREFPSHSFHRPGGLFHWKSNSMYGMYHLYSADEVPSLSGDVFHGLLLCPSQAEPTTKAEASHTSGGGTCPEGRAPSMGCPPRQRTTRNKAKNSNLPNKQKQGPAGVGGPLPQSPGRGCGPCLCQRNRWSLSIQEGSSAERLELRL